MAAPLTRPGVLDLLEEAVHTLRAAPLATLATHAIGSAPFVIGLLVFWNDMGQARTPDAKCAFEALVLTLLLLWMNCWRAVFAGRIRRQLGGRSELPWTSSRIWGLIANQALLGGTKPLVSALAVMLMLPMAWCAGFYRSAASLADREDLDLSQLIARSRKLAGLEQRQGWGILLLLSILYLVLLLNVLIMLAILPQLIRILIGYESVFSRGAFYYVSNSLFWLAAASLAWMALDPFTQTVYCLRAFQLESRTTGEDLRAALRTLASAAVILLAAGHTAVAQVTPANLERSIQQSLQSPVYDWRLAPAAGKKAGNALWLVTATDRVMESVEHGLHRVGDAIDRLIDWLREKLPGSSSTDSAKPPSAALHWSVYAIIAALLVLIALIVWRLRKTRARPAALVVAGTSAVSLQDEHLSADRLPEEEWVAMAEQCARGGNYRDALRALYLANLAWLGRREWIAIHSGKTNREYEIEMRRRTRQFPEARALFAANVVTFERVWYGRHAAGAEDMEAFRARLDRMKAAA